MLYPPAQYLDATATQGRVEESSGTVLAELGTLASGSVATVIVTVKALAPGQTENSASTTGAESDPVADNNFSTATCLIEPCRADICITKRAHTPLVLVGETLDFLLEVANHGPQPATGVVALDTLPPGVEFLSASASQGAVSESSGIVAAELGSLENGATATVTIRVKAAVAGKIENRATAAAFEADPDLTNNAASAESRASVPLPDLTGELEATQAFRGRSPRQRGQIRGVCNVRNIGTAAAETSRLRIDLSSEPTPGSPDAMKVYQQTVRKLAAAGTPRGRDSQTCRFTATLPAGQTATGKYLIAVVDADGAIAELREDNNQALLGPVP